MLIDLQPFLRHLKLNRDCTPQTLKAYTADLNDLETFLHEENLTGVEELTPRLVGTYIERMKTRLNRRTKKEGLANASIARKLASASSYMEFLRGSSDENLRNPFSAHRFRWKRYDNPNPVEEYTLDLLLASMPLREQVLFRVIVSSGLRVEEASSLNRDSIEVQTDVDENGKEYTLGVGTVVGKGKKLRTFRIDGETALLCAEYIESREDDGPELFTTTRRSRMSVRAIQERMQHWCSYLGFSHINVHRLRHTFATRMAENGMPHPTLKKLMGHESLNTLAKYYRLGDDTLSRSYHAALQQARGR